MATAAQSVPFQTDNPLIIAGTSYQSRLLVGTGKYKDNEETRLAIEASGAEIITVAIRRMSSRSINTRCYPIQPAAIPLKTQYAPAGWRVSCLTVTNWSNWKYWEMKKPCFRM